MESNVDFWGFLRERFRIEREKFDRSGVYEYTQRLLAYNSNKIDRGEYADGGTDRLPF